MSSYMFGWFLCLAVTVSVAGETPVENTEKSAEQMQEDPGIDKIEHHIIYRPLLWLATLWFHQIHRAHCVFLLFLEQIEQERVFF